MKSGLLGRGMRFAKSLGLLLALLTAACASGAASTGAGRVVTVDGGSYRAITVTQLKSMLDQKDFVLVNVHIPYAGEIKGTDLFVPYDAIEANLGKLPADKEAKIVVYCRSGRMSKIAAEDLTRLGYRNVLDVEGGMEEWENAGYPLGSPGT
jgi:rhodanese-related sulfurtransferase